MSIFAFPATPKVTVLMVPSNLAEAHNFVGEKWNLCLGFPVNEISLDIGFAGARDSRTRGLCREN
jgi:hypothetical protein